MHIPHINVRPKQITNNLLAEFPTALPIRQPVERPVPIGIEVEVPWRAYFPDLWVEGFPNIDENLLQQITAECSIRELTLLPKLHKTVECGIKRGNDRYWEFALDPVTDVTIACDQISILRTHNLIPAGQHSLHITFGGVRVTRDMYYVALILEMLACDGQRVMKGFHPRNPSVAHGWARKGFAGVYEKEGDHDIMHGMNVGAEVRLLWLPETDSDLVHLLSVAQTLASLVYQKQQGIVCSSWTSVVEKCSTILREHGLPDQNWKRPVQEPDIWIRFADQMPAIKRAVQTALTNTEFEYILGDLNGNQQ